MVSINILSILIWCVLKLETWYCALFHRYVTGTLLMSISIKSIGLLSSFSVVEMNSTLWRAQRADVFRSSLRICLIFVAIAVKSCCFCQPDGISITLLEEDVYRKENFICSSLFATKAHEKYVYQRKRIFLYLLSLMCGGVEKCPVPTESNIQDLFNQKRLKVFHQNMRGLFHNIAKLSIFLHTHKNPYIFSQWNAHW